MALFVPFQSLISPLFLVLGFPISETAVIAPVVLPCVLFPYICINKLSISPVVLANFPTITEDVAIQINASN